MQNFKEFILSESMSVLPEDVLNKVKKIMKSKPFTKYSEGDDFISAHIGSYEGDGDEDEYIDEIVMILRKYARSVNSRLIEKVEKETDNLVVRTYSTNTSDGLLTLTVELKISSDDYYGYKITLEVD